MDVHTNPGPQPPAVEPKGMTLADLVILIIGCGLAFAPPWEFFDAPYGPAPRLCTFLTHVGEGLERLCLGLALVILVRRVRYRGSGRPVEWLVLFCAMPFLVEVVEHLPWIVNSYQQAPAVTVPMLEPGPAYWMWMRISAVGCAIAAVASVALRRRLPGWGRMIVASLGVLGYWAGGAEYFYQGFDALMKYAGIYGDITDLVGEALQALVVGLIYGVPMIQVLFDRPRSAWSWAAWAGACLSLSLIVVVVGLAFYAVRWTAQPEAVVPALALGATSLVSSLALSAWIVWAMRLRGRRQSGKPSTPPAEPHSTALNEQT